MKKSCACWNGCTHGRGGFVYRGSTDYLSRGKPPQRSAAVDDLIRRAVAAPDDDPLYVVAIGAITNVAALLLEPDLVRKIVVVWLGGNTHHQPSTMEFNLMQDRMPPGSFSTAACRSSRFLAWAWLRTF